MSVTVRMRIGMTPMMRLLPGSHFFIVCDPILHYTLRQQIFDRPEITTSTSHATAIFC